MSRPSRKRRAESSGELSHADTSAHAIPVEELQCTVCMQVYTEPHSLPCGHTFCRACICPRVWECPLCRFHLTNHQEQMIPNRVLYKLVDAYKETQEHARMLKINAPTSSRVPGLPESFAECVTDPRLDLSTVSQMMQFLESKRQSLTTYDEDMKNTLLSHFVQEMISRRACSKKQIEQELHVLQKDLEIINKCAISTSANCDESKQQLVPETCKKRLSTETKGAENLTTLRSSPNRDRLASEAASEVSDGDSDVMEMSAHAQGNGTMYKKKQRLEMHFDDLQSIYLNMTGIADEGGADGGDGHLSEMAEVLSKSTQYSSMKRIASLNYNMGSTTENQLNIVSSIEFDREGEYLAVAGVTRRIKLYDYNQVVADRVDVHYPVAEMNSLTKISCVSWSQFRRSLLASSDYEGSVQLWDAMQAKEVKRFQEHEKRAWSVNFSNTDPRLLASGSDDTKVKLWSLNSSRSIGQIDAQVNVCCVHFGPDNSNLLAFGCADHCVHVYDVRALRKAVHVFKGHKKAVSYVKFINANEIISASTDGSLKLWNTESTVGGEACSRSFTGHLNEKNFVGLAGDQDFIICGSETNTVYMYYKGICKPLLQYTLPTPSQLARHPSFRDDATNNEFVSAVAWKRKSNVVVAANSQGVIQLLSLV